MFIVKTYNELCKDCNKSDHGLNRWQREKWVIVLAWLDGKHIPLPDLPVVVGLQYALDHKPPGPVICLSL